MVLKITKNRTTPRHEHRYCKSTRHTAKIDFDTISVALYTVVLKVTHYKYETHGTISATAYTEVHRSSCTTIISVWITRWKNFPFVLHSKRIKLQCSNSTLSGQMAIINYEATSILRRWNYLDLKCVGSRVEDSGPGGQTSKIMGFTDIIVQKIL